MLSRKISRMFRKFTLTLGRWVVLWMFFRAIFPVTTFLCANHIVTSYADGFRYLPDGSVSHVIRGLEAWEKFFTMGSFLK